MTLFPVSPLGEPFLVERSRAPAAAMRRVDNERAELDG